ncbi:MAG TPA: type III-B CRISPR module RAMP protein Cmr4 [Chthonomonadales bacterium]|nr:type III-B CRISPR module RAMP protein Cmr4 [Chthonomonadales bacterium]
MASYEKFLQVGIALDPIHVGTGGARIGRVDLTIVRDPVTQVPKIPGSSLAGLYRTYVAMVEHKQKPNRPVDEKEWPIYPNCAGLGQSQEDKARSEEEKKYRRGHCGRPDCPVCTVFGFARGKDQAGGFAGLAAFTDAHVLLLPVPTRRGPIWVTCPMALRVIGLEVQRVEENAVYLENGSSNQLNLGWLLLPVQVCSDMGTIKKKLQNLSIPDYIQKRLALVPDCLFAHIVNSNLEVRTSVSIDPATGAAEERALFSYEALPRGTVLVWEIIAKSPKHFQVSGKPVSVIFDNGQQMDTPDKVHQVVQTAHPYLEYLGIGGMGTRGMGRLKVVYAKQSPTNQTVSCGSLASGQAIPSTSQGGQS